MEYKFNDANFETEVENYNGAVMVDFYADWCGPCKMMGPVVEELSEKYDGRVRVGKINVDESEETAAKYRVMSIPSILFFKNGKVVDTSVGAVPISSLIERLDNLIK
jgi:thioredoxin 1